MRAIPGLELENLGTCEAPGCDVKAIEVLRGKPSETTTVIRLELAFCDQHADEYRRLGYQPLEA